MPTFDDSVTEIAGVGKKTRQRFNSTYGTKTIGGLISESEWRRLRSRIRPQYYEDAKQNVLHATLNSTPSNFQSEAHARAEQWKFLFYGDDLNRATYRSNHVVLGNWRGTPTLPDDGTVNIDVETVVPTHRTITSTAVSYDDSSGAGIVPAYFLSGQELQLSAGISDSLLDGQYDPNDTLIPAKTIGLLASLFDTTPKRLLKDSTFMPDGPVAFDDPATGLSVLVGPMARPNVDQQDADAGIDEEMVAKTGMIL